MTMSILSYHLGHILLEILQWNCEGLEEEIIYLHIPLFIQPTTINLSSIYHFLSIIHLSSISHF